MYCRVIPKEFDIVIRYNDNSNKTIFKSKNVQKWLHILDDSVLCMAHYDLIDEEYDDCVLDGYDTLSDYLTKQLESLKVNKI